MKYNIFITKNETSSAKSLLKQLAAIYGPEAYITVCRGNFNFRNAMSQQMGYIESIKKADVLYQEALSKDSYLIIFLVIIYML